MVPVFRGGGLSDIGQARMATLFCYLTTTCWRGVWRTNLKGEFNVNFGDRKNCQPRTNEIFGEYKEIIKGWKFFASDFRSLPVADVKHPFVYIDPPYEGTKSLYGQKFLPPERVELIKWASQFPTVVASDNPVDWVVQSYRNQGFDVEIIDSTRGLASKDGTPGKVPEMMAFKGISREEIFLDGCLVA